MRLNLPFTLRDRRVLLAGAGGGWDAFGALPLAYELRDACRLVFASYSAHVGGFDVREARPDDCPEGKLAALIDEPLYVFGKEGARSLRRGYDRILRQHAIDVVVLVDGGVDSLMRGDEEGPGTILQDSLSLAVVNELDVPDKILACVGFGTETEEGLCHYRALENIAALAKEGAFLGACALTGAMESFRYYERVCRQAFDQPGTRSHIHSRIIPAVHGEFGRYEMYDDPDQPFDLLADRPPFLSPLMPFFWFFEATKVARRNRLLESFTATETWDDVEAAYEALFPLLRAEMRRNREIPL